MKPAILNIAVAGALGLSLAAAATAIAQDRPAGPGGPPGAGRGAERQKIFQAMEQRREQRLHDLLQIKPDQEAAFHTFVTSLEQMRPKGERGPRQPGERPMLTTPERLDRAVQRLGEAQARLQKASAAIKTFYAVLTPDQRKAFDLMPMPIGGERGRPGMRMHGWRGGGFGGPPRGRLD